MSVVKNNLTGLYEINHNGEDVFVTVNPEDFEVRVNDNGGVEIFYMKPVSLGLVLSLEDSDLVLNELAGEHIKQKAEAARMAAKAAAYLYLSKTR